MTPDEAKALLPFVQALAEGKRVEERYSYPTPTTRQWTDWHEIRDNLKATDETYQLRIVEPEPTQEQKDDKAFHDWTLTGNKRSNPWPIEVWHAALAWERKRVKEEGR